MGNVGILGRRPSLATAVAFLAIGFAASLFASSGALWLATQPTTPEAAREPLIWGPAVLAAVHAFLSLVLVARAHVRQRSIGYYLALFAALAYLALAVSGVALWVWMSAQSAT